MSRWRVKTKIPKQGKLWGGIFLFLTMMQFGSLYAMDRFLQPPSLAAVAPVEEASGDEEVLIEPEMFTIEVPADAVKYVIDGSDQYVAYTTKENELIVEGQEGVIFQKNVGDEVYFEWLGKTKTLFYAYEGRGLNAYLLPVHGNETEPTWMKTWTGNREVVKTYFSPYLEFLYVQVKNDTHTEMYRYEATLGMKRLGVEGVEIITVEYDDKTDTMLMTDEHGDNWRYENDRLYRPDGALVREQPTKVEADETRWTQPKPESGMVK